MADLLRPARPSLSPLFIRTANFVARMRRTGRSSCTLDNECLTSASLRVALALLPVPVVVMRRDGAVIHANPEALELLGYRSKDLNNVCATQIFRDLGNSELLAMPEDAASSGQGAPCLRVVRTLVAKRGDGSEIPLTVTISARLVDDAPAFFAALADARDPHALPHNRQELTHLTRVSALGELAGSLAHELNQPLTAILSNAQAAQRFLDADSIDLNEVRETLGDIVDDNRRAGDIIRKIRLLARKGDMELQPLDPGCIVRDVTRLVHSDAVIRGVRTVLDIEDDLPPVAGDKVQLQQVILNLLLNSFDAVQDCMPSRRVVCVEVRSQSDDTVCIAVRDHGQGLTVDQIDRIFSPFVTSKPHGLGLGLSISRSIVAAHSGRIWAESNPDQGATFYVVLPCRHSPV